jgi:hypothetical protein
MGYQIKRREDDLGMGAGSRRVHFELWLDDRRSPTATAVIEDGGTTVNWSALGDVPPRRALDFAQGLAALVHTVNLEDAERLRGAIAEFLAPIAEGS